MSSKRSAAYEGGFGHFNRVPQGLRISCPYASGTPERRDWIRGYGAANAIRFPPPQQLEVFDDWRNNSGIHRLYCGDLTIRTLAKSLTRSATHVTIFVPSQELDYTDQEECYVESPLVVGLLLGKAPGAIIVDALLELDSLPRWVRKELEATCKKLAQEAQS